MNSLVLCLLFAGALAVPTGKPRFRKGLNKIVGGSEAAPGEFPYQLSFQDKFFGYDWHFCGASIYNEHYAISAGHCVEGHDYDHPKKLQVVAGEHNLNIDEGSEQTIAVSKIVLHENYGGSSIVNDISLLKLESPLIFNEHVSGIALPEQGHAASGDCVVTGWGDLFEGGDSPSKLMKVTVPVMSDEECRAGYGQSEIEDSMLCAGDPEGGKDRCQGDAGGPLACKDTGVEYLAGIVSWGFGCARPEYPGVYTEVSYFVDWIEANAV